MLPSFPQITSFRHEQNLRLLKKRIEVHSPLNAGIRKHIQHEGRTAQIERYDNTVDPTEFVGAQGEMSVSRVPMRDFSLSEVAAAYDDIALQFAKQFDQMMACTLDNVTAKTGNVVDAKGAMDADKVFELFEKMDFSFAPDGTWQPPTIWGGGAAIAVHEQVMSDPAFQERLGKLINRKRDEFRHREANRVLVG